MIIRVRHGSRIDSILTLLCMHVDRNGVHERGVFLTDLSPDLRSGRGTVGAAVRLRAHKQLVKNTKHCYLCSFTCARSKWLHAVFIRETSLCTVRSLWKPCRRITQVCRDVQPRNTHQHREQKRLITVYWVSRSATIGWARCNASNSPHFLGRPQFSPNLKFNQ